MNKDLKKVKEHVLCTCGGRAFQAEATGSAKALWCDGPMQEKEYHQSREKEGKQEEMRSESQ